MNIVIPDYIDMPEEPKDKIRQLGGVIHDDLPQSPGDLIERIKDAELITANYVDITKEVIEAAPKLRYIVVPAVGYEWVDVAYASSKGVVVVNCPTFNSQAVAEHALTLLLAVSRQIVTANDSIKAGNWDQARFSGLELAGKNLGLIGYGNIGKRIERLVSGFGMSVSFVNSRSSAGEVDELLQVSKFVCVCAPLNEKTRHMLDARRLSLLQKDAILVNVGRGAIIEQVALRKMLADGSLRGAGLDVFEGEPLTGHLNQAIMELAKLPNVVATPHMGYNTQETAERLGYEIAENIEACIAGHPIHVIR